MAGIAERVFFFRSQIHNRRFGEETLRILESVLVSKDVKSLQEIRSSLRGFMRHESVAILREITEKSVHQKLSTVNFFVKSFALVGDVESCLALKYEAFSLRDIKYANHQGMRVSYSEWLNFAENSRNNGFYSIAIKGYENALQHIQLTETVNSGPGILSAEAEVEKVQELKDAARALLTSNSVEAQTAVYLKRKSIHQNSNTASLMGIQHSASSMFRSAIKKRNTRKLHDSQRLHRNITGS